ncbi:MAG: HAMP domain-containing histidine kinase [Deltaproteobacteria bacterium]|nr:HAMP domain-containing histidine kinase [Deltaproteobacteria bacterium]
MNAAAGRLTQAVMAALIVVTLVAAAALVFVAPRFLLLDPGMAPNALINGIEVGSVTMTLTLVATWLRMRRMRFTLRALGLGSRWVEPEELDALDRAPAQVTITALAIAVAGIVSTLLPGLRPEGFDFDSTASLALLAITIACVAALPLYVIIRQRVARAIQLAPEDSIRELLERVSRRPEPAQRIVSRARLALLAPVGLVGFGVALLAHAHVLSFEARGRLATATAIAQGALEPVPGPVPDAGELDAAQAAAEHDFIVRLNPTSAPFRIERKPTGRVVVTVPLDVGHATVSFVGTTIIALTASGVVVAIIAALLASMLGAAVGRTVADDLAQATRRVQLLGTEAVLRGEPRIARPARYAMVAALGEAIERLAERFRVFASAQEQAIEAREAARRMRGLLFASVSHDLKSPLNSVLGFADLIDEQQMSPPQQESLDVIKRRGSELLGLIQTILDAARVEAGQLVVQKSKAAFDELVLSAVNSAREIAGPGAIQITFDIAPSLPPVTVDPTRVIEALAALIRHAVRTTHEGQVRVIAEASGNGRDLVVDIEAPSRMIPAANLARLLLPDGESTMPRSLGGLALGLSLANSLLVLHGGSVEVFDTADGIVLRARVPIDAEPTA